MRTRWCNMPFSTRWQACSARPRKLWNTGQGSVMMREAVSLMGGYGITEDCPGFLGHKWMDSQLEATYEGPEAVQRRNLTVTMTNELFLAQFRNWVVEMRQLASVRPGTGACALATRDDAVAVDYEHLQSATDADGNKLYHGTRQGVTFALADALCWLLAARQQVLDVLELEQKGPENPVVAEGLAGTVQFFSDLCHVQVARAAGEAGRICAELVNGYNRHPAWDEEGYKGCYRAEELDGMENLIPGIAAVRDGCGGRRRLASAEGGSVRQQQRAGRIQASAQPARWLPDRLDAGERSRGGGADQGHDSGSARLSDVVAGFKFRFQLRSLAKEELFEHEEQPVEVERQSLEVDIACVGFGPAMGGFLTTLARGLVKEDGSPTVESQAMPGMPLQVICYERADDLGFGVSGVVSRARGIQRSFPELDVAQIPMAARVRQEKVVYLLDPIGASRRSRPLRMLDKLIKGLGFALPLEHDAIELPYTPEFLNKHDGLLLSLGQFNLWVGSQIMGSGSVQIWPGMPVSRIALRDERQPDTRRVPRYDA